MKEIKNVKIKLEIFFIILDLNTIYLYEILDIKKRKIPNKNEKNKQTI